MLLDIVKQCQEYHNNIIFTPPPPQRSPTINLTREYLTYIWDIDAHKERKILSNDLLPIWKVV